MEFNNNCARDEYTREENQIPFVDDEDDETIPEPPKKTSRTVSSTGASCPVANEEGGKVEEKKAKQLQGKFFAAWAIIILSCHLYIIIKNGKSHLIRLFYVSIRRWAVLAFGWLCSGQKRLLDMGAVMLSNTEVWEAVMEMTNNSVAGATTIAVSEDYFPRKPAFGAPSLPLSKSTRKRKKRKENDKSHSTSTENQTYFGFDSDTANTIERSTGCGGNSSAAVPCSSAGKSSLGQFRSSSD